jgi:hypothetical protein
VGDLNGDATVPGLRLSCLTPRPEDLLRIDAASVRNRELRWMRLKVAEHHSADLTVLEAIRERGSVDDDALAAVIADREASLSAIQAGAASSQRSTAMLKGQS